VRDTIEAVGPKIMLMGVGMIHTQREAAYYLGALFRDTSAVSSYVPYICNYPGEIVATIPGSHVN
jgi:hypothetical protein